MELKKVIKHLIYCQNKTYKSSYWNIEAPVVRFSDTTLLSDIERR